MLGNSTQRSSPTARGQLGACAAGHPAEVEAGLEVLAAGGNAIDAVVAAAFAGFVVEQLDCGLGGFARITVWVEASQRFETFDGYVRAPGAARDDMFAVTEDPHSYYGHPPTVGETARYGPLAVAIPGAVAALCAARDALGSRPMTELLAPAIDLADGGVAFGWREALTIASLEDEIRRFPAAARALMPGGRLPRIAVQRDDADRMDTAALATTLRRIAERGPSDFYGGRTGKRLAAFIAEQGGVLAADDLAGYRAGSGVEVPGLFRGCRYASCGDHVSREALGILDGLDLGEPDGVDFRHYMAEALGAAFTDVLTHYGDPDFVHSPTDGLASRGFAEHRRAQLRSDRALARPIRPADPWPWQPGGRSSARAEEPGPATREGTSQMVAADRHGNVATVITAVGWNYGSLMYDPDTGIFLNNGMLYFDPRPGRVASIAPGKMPLFGAPPLVAVDDRHRYGIAGSGGYRIETAVLHTLIHQLVFAMSPQQALEHPRVHCQGSETFVDSRIDARVRRALTRLGHRVETLSDDASSLHFGRAAAITRNHESGELQASSSPQWMSAAGAV